jgi:hypothetical protein
MTKFLLVGTVVFALMTGVSFAQSGASSGAPHKTHHGAFDAGDRYTDALNYLEAHGYFHATNLADDGDGFTATAWYDGRQVLVRLDPATGTIENRG